MSDIIPMSMSWQRSNMVCGTQQRSDECRHHIHRHSETATDWEFCASQCLSLRDEGGWNKNFLFSVCQAFFLPVFDPHLCRLLSEFESMYIYEV